LASDASNHTIGRKASVHLGLGVQELAKALKKKHPEEYARYKVD
jgi:hypothetical protein